MLDMVTDNPNEDSGDCPNTSTSMGATQAMAKVSYRTA
mgnify:CR=1 FL=1